MNAPSSAPCPTCGGTGRVVPLGLVRHHVRRAWARDLASTTWRFCSAGGCEVVYFGTDGTSIGVEDVRRAPAYKTEHPADLLCFCFDVTGQQALGTPDPVPYISERVRLGECACDVLNPRGDCCLGSIGSWRNAQNRRA